MTLKAMLKFPWGYHRKYRLLHTPLLFPSSQDPQKPLDLRKQWESAVRKAEIEDFRYHDLRLERMPRILSLAKSYTVYLSHIWTVMKGIR